jgi:hypothetical protein
LEVQGKERSERFHIKEKTPKIKRWKFGLVEIWKFKVKKETKGFTEKKSPQKLSAGSSDLWKFGSS